jgi:5'-3' exonuclease
MPPVELIKEETISKSTYSVGALPPPLRPQAQVQRMELPPEFIEKFKSTFVSKINDIDKKLKLKNTIKYVGKDCRRSDIWRTALYPDYKGTRDSTTPFLGAPLFQMVYDEQLYENAGVKQLLSYPSLEADDCIAILVKNYINKYPTCSINIITSDRDYLQLQEYNNVNICDLTYKKLRTSGSAKDDLNIKIIMGDTSDNIPSVFPKCGEKTALKCCQDNAFFLKKMNNNEEYYKQYELNKKLVDFNNIPQNLVDEFISQLEI